MTWAFSIFCDDIRQEAGNKLSYMGVYRNAMFVSEEFPVAIPKICVAAFVVVPKDTDPEQTTSLFVRRHGEENPLLRANVPLNEILGNSTEFNPLGHKITAAVGTFHFFITPLTLPQPTTLEVVLSLNSNEVDAGSLEIRNP